MREVVTLVLTVDVSSKGENTMIHTPFLGESTPLLGTSILAMQTRNPDKNVREELLRIPRPAVKKIGKCKCKQCGQECFAPTVFLWIEEEFALHIRVCEVHGSPDPRNTLSTKVQRQKPRSNGTTGSKLRNLYP